MPESIQAWIRDATTRYLTDPDFHARARWACDLTEKTAKHLGHELTGGERNAILQAAVYGLMMFEENLPAGLASETIRNMHATAEVLGMSVVANRETPKT